MNDRVMTPLCELAKKHGTDKGGWHYIAGDTCHAYTPVYHELFKDRREKVRNVLEIGVNHGCSLRMLEEYFPYADIVGLDCNAACLFNAGRIHCVQADQGSADSLLEAMVRLNLREFDLIVDDGSHEDAHQILSANMLLPSLADDGVYVIEDLNIDCQPNLIGDRLTNPAFKWESLDCGIGLGKARCHPNCRYCGGKTGEQLLVIRRV